MNLWYVPRKYFLYISFEILKQNVFTFQGTTDPTEFKMSIRDEANTITLEKIISRSYTHGDCELCKIRSFIHAKMTKIYFRILPPNRNLFGYPVSPVTNHLLVFLAHHWTKCQCYQFDEWDMCSNLFRGNVAIMFLCETVRNSLSRLQWRN